MAAVAEFPDDNSVHPLLQRPSPPPDQNDAVQPSRRLATTSFTVAAVACLSLLLLASLTAYAFWPSDPTLTIVRLRLTKVKIHTVPFPIVDITVRVTVEVRNVDVYSVGLSRLDVVVSYRGKRLGEVTAAGEGRPTVVVGALTTSYLEAEMEVNGIGVLSDGLLLMRDLKRGKVPFGTVAEVGGRLGFLSSFGFPFKAKMSCEVLLNTHNGTIVRQSCN
ncbi:unnamed protein product [Linum tenue]|uniref:Late embryogenesis abundant protein LEA-2 subgroup domain-containing protein n=1 Tax=Linum tenue TaxID=586396 RepID=A0AAV0KL37_9ROSI|nr:unnamed protein product [Linum tenue]